MNHTIYNTLYFLSWMRYTCHLIFLSALLLSIASNAQEKRLVQIKTFDQQLQVVKNLEISINGKDFITIGNKGTAFVEINDNELPLKSVKIKNEELEAASWNYSKGVVEIIIRKRNYRLTQWIVTDKNDVPIKNLTINFNGKKTITVKSNDAGRFEIPLALEEKITSPAQFTVGEYDVVSYQSSEKENVLIVNRKIQEVPVDRSTVSDKRVSSQEYFKDFDLSKLDSIQSLTMFYAIFKKYPMKDLSAVSKRRIDAKFSELVKLLQDSVRSKGVASIGKKISDSSFVSEDIKSLLDQAAQEKNTLALQREEFNEKVRIITDKLALGIENLNAETRRQLLSDLSLLEKLLIENESRFFKNQNDYRQIINSLKEKFFNVENLENKLSVSEAQRLEEQRIFTQRLIAILFVVILFAVLIITLITFSNALRKQKKELVRANDEIKRINENLEGLVAQRTKLLAEANRELDIFLYRASHDLRSPVCSIIGLCNIAAHLSHGESKDLIEKVVHTTAAMDRLLKKLSIISEINQPSNFSSITLLDMVESVQHQFEKVIKSNQVKWKVDCPADMVIYSYPNLLQAILTNLMENALFYSVLKNRGNAIVEVTAALKNGQLVISVYDNGVGIDKAIIPRLYDMFFKGNENSKGNGLGLYIVYKSVQALEGNISMESELHQYTRFTVFLPLRPVPVNALPENGLHNVLDTGTRLVAAQE
jgi:signal transduction histidine kinase